MPHDDFHSEPVLGLPETPPEGERLLWQGRPRVWGLAREALNIHWVILYFAGFALWRGLAVGLEQGLATGFKAASPFLVLGAITVLILWGLAAVFARTTMYTITNRRVAMRIGAALTVTLNLPHRWIASADLQLRSDGTGTIALDLRGENKLSFLVCWPHTRPWRMRHTQPALRAIPEAEKVARILAEAATARLTQSASADRPTVAPAAVAAE